LSVKAAHGGNEEGYKTWRSSFTELTPLVRITTKKKRRILKMREHGKEVGNNKGGGSSGNGAS